MNQYQRMVSYLYEYKQGVKGVNVGYVRIEQKGGACRIFLQMRGRNLGQLSDVAVFRQGTKGIQYLSLCPLTERNGDYRCRIETEIESLAGSGIALSEVDGIILYQDDSYYVATTWKNTGIRVGERQEWSQSEAEEKEEPSKDPKLVPEQESESGETTAGHSGMTEPSRQMERPSQEGEEPSRQMERSSQEGEEASRQMAGSPRTAVESSQNVAGTSRQITEPQQEIAGAALPQRTDKTEATPLIHTMEQTLNDAGQMRKSATDRQKRKQMEARTVCGNCPFKRKATDYGKRILMTFPSMRPFPDDASHACVRIEPQDLGCLPMQFWHLANNQFLLQGYYGYRHLIFLETGEHHYALGIPGIYSERDRRQAEQFGFPQFRSICTGRHCMGAFGYWMMPLSL